MRKFLFRILLFAIPILFLAIPPLFVLKTSGENFKNIDNIIHNNPKYLIGYAYNEQNYKYLKWKTLIVNPKYEIIALGSSRVLPFRSNMFSTSFYNAGYTVANINAYIPFLKSISTTKYPNYLIIGLDQWMFNSSWDNLSYVFPNETWSQSFRNNPDLTTLKNVWNDLLYGKYNIFIPRSHDHINRIGLNANINNKGFRNDGSIYYGDQIQKLLKNDTTASDYNYEDTYSRINQGNRLFEYGNSINPNALMELDKLLMFCKNNKIFVIAFIPPLANKVNSKLFVSGKYKYMENIYPESLNYFKKYGFELYDFSTLNNCNSNDNETIDGFHAGEVTYMKLLVKILEHQSVLNNITSIEKLRNDLSHQINNYEVYAN